MLTSEQVQAAFKCFGKLIKLGDLAEDYTSTLKLHQAATADQAVSASEESYPILRNVVMPLEMSVGRVIAGVEAVPLRARQAVESYLRAVADDLGVSPAATTAVKLNALKSSMINAEETVAPYGALYSYFFSGWGVALPSAEPETIPDSYITTTIV
jgi:hypothetical protein